MERNKTYRFMSSFKTTLTDGTVEEFKGLTFKVVSIEGQYTTFCECKIENVDLPYLIKEEELNKLLEEGKIIEENTPTVLHVTVDEETDEIKIEEGVSE